MSRTHGWYPKPKYPVGGGLNISQEEWDRIFGGKKELSGGEVLDSGCSRNNPPSPSAQSITCPKCGMTSHNPNDVKNRYCGNCHQFLDDAEGRE